MEAQRSIEPRALLVGVSAGDIDPTDWIDAGPIDATDFASHSFNERALRIRQASSLSDVNGLTWLGGDLFLAAHDAKNPDENSLPRASLLKLPADLEGVLYRPMRINWPGLKSSDLESAARIPGTNDVLLVESGDNGDPVFHRIFRASVEDANLRIRATADWPLSVDNAESSAVAKVGDHYVFLFAERGENQPSTDVRWARFNPQTLQFGEFHSVTFDNPDPLHVNRPIVAMDVDSHGRIVVASAFDAEAAGLPNPDNGPFSSSVWTIGRIDASSGDRPQVTLLDQPRHVATLNGLKVESVAVREDADGRQLFVGVDDENYGGTIRRLPLPSDFAPQPYIVFNTNDSGAGSLRQAILNGNAGVYVAGDAHHNVIGGQRDRRRNLINANGGSGVEVTGAAHHNQIVANLIGSNRTGRRGGTGNLGAGVLLDQHARHNAVWENRVWNNSDSGLVVAGGGHNALRSNLAINNSADGFHVEQSIHNQFDDNDAYLNDGFGFFVDEVLANMFDDNHCALNAQGDSNQPDVC